MKNQSNELQPSAKLGSLQTVPKTHPFSEFKEKVIRAGVIVMEVGKVYTTAQEVYKPHGPRQSSTKLNLQKPRMAKIKRQYQLLVKM